MVVVHTVHATWFGLQSEQELLPVVTASGVKLQALKAGTMNTARLFNYQLNAQFIYLFYNNIYYIIILYMFRAIPCSSSEGQIVLL